MAYTEKQIAEFKSLARDAGLFAPQDFMDAPNSELVKVCNGVGAEWLSERTRKILTKAFKCAEASAAIHDWMYHNSDGIYKNQREADKLFRRNALDEIECKYHWLNPWRFWAQRKILLAYDALCRMGKAQWAISNCDKLPKNCERGT